MDELLAIVHSGKFQDSGCMDLVHATWNDHNLTLRFNLTLDRDHFQGWIIQCTSAVEYFISKASNCGLQHWTNDHPVVAQYAEPYEDLYFGKAADDPAAFLGKVWLAHRDATDDWIPFDRYLNRQVAPTELFAASRGLFATGPSFLVEVYAEMLSREGMQPKRLASSDADTYLPEAKMIHFGESYVVAADFSCTMADV